MLMNESVEGKPITPTVGKVCDVHPLVALCLALTPAQQSLLRALEILPLDLNVVDLEPQDDGPYEPEHEGALVVHNVLRPDRLKMHLLLVPS